MFYGEADASGLITEVACWAYARRGLQGLILATKAPLAMAAIERIARFYGIEAEANG
jgi:hypothetical protein